MGGQKGNDAEKKKEELTAAVENLTVLKAALPETADVQKRLCNLIEMLNKYKFDESMLIALPSALGKAPDARGRFDLIAISQLESKIDEMVAEQAAILAAAAPGQAKCDAAIKQATDCFTAARSGQMEAAKVFDVASKELAACEAIHKSAQRAVRDHAQSLGRLEKALRNADSDLEIFQEGPLDTFRQLCGRVTVPVVEEAHAVECMEDAVVTQQPDDALCAAEVPPAVP